MKNISRRKFLNITGLAGLSLAGIGGKSLFAGIEKQSISDPDLAVVSNSDPATMVQKAVEMIGGIERFVKKGNTVVIKPNIGWDRSPEQAATTNPEVVAEIVRLCKKAGASKVKVFDRTCNREKRCYLRSGIEEAAEKAGADVSFIYPQKFKKVAIQNGKILKSWEFYQDALEADVFINVPIAKHHSLSKVTLSYKNVMGIIGGNRGTIHTDFNEKIIDLNTVIKPHITILDAVRILMNNGPQGGNLEDVKTMNTIVAGIDPFIVDSFGATFFNLTPANLDFLKEAAGRGWGSLNLKDYKIAKVNLNS